MLDKRLNKYYYDDLLTIQENSRLYIYIIK